MAVWTGLTDDSGGHSEASLNSPSDHALSLLCEESRQVFEGDGLRLRKVSVSLTHAYSWLKGKQQGMQRLQGYKMVWFTKKPGLVSGSTTNYTLNRIFPVCVHPYSPPHVWF